MTRAPVRSEAVPALDMDYVLDTLQALLEIPSPTGYTDQIVRWTAEELGRLGLTSELTRRGAIRVTLPAATETPHRALVAHLDTLGAMVADRRPDGRLAIAPVGTWSARFAEGARVTILTEEGPYRGTILPAMASGHRWGEAVDAQPAAWDNLEVRVDEVVSSATDLERLGIRVGDFVAVDSELEVTPSGFLKARHLDDKAGVAVLLGTLRALVQADVTLPMPCHWIFTISEEVGSGASHTLHRDVAEMVTVDNAVQAPGQNSTEHAVTIAMMDQAGPFDWHLTRVLIGLCEEHALPYRRDVFRHYRSDSASAVDAGNDVRTALACFGLDASHGWERTHADALRALGTLVIQWALSEPFLRRDRHELAPLDEGFPEQPAGDGGGA